MWQRSRKKKHTEEDDRLGDAIQEMTTEWVKWGEEMGESAAEFTEGQSQEGPGCRLKGLDSTGSGLENRGARDGSDPREF